MSIADRLFAAQIEFGVAEGALWDELFAIFTENCNFDDCSFDHYDGSIELIGWKPNKDVADDQLKRLLDMGFGHGWVRFGDGNEFHFGRGSGGAAISRGPVHRSVHSYPIAAPQHDPREGDTK